MKTQLKILTAIMLIAGCNGNAQPNLPDDIPTKKDDPVKTSPLGTLTADGNDAGTYELLEKSGFIYQGPDKIGGHKGKPEQHIHQLYDGKLGKNVFAFSLHAATDIDVCLQDKTDRQRNEIAIAGKDPSPIVAGEKETLKIEWKFFLPEGMLVSSQFCHIYQIKALCSQDRPSDIDTPLITISLKEIKGEKKLTVSYKPPHSNDTEYLFEDDMNKYTGRWIQAESRMTTAVDGSIDMKLTDIAAGKVLCDLKDVKRDLWRDGATGIRPKWGLYRSVGTDGSLRSSLRDETLLFADIICYNINRQ